MSNVNASYDAWHTRHAVDDGISTPWHQLAAGLLNSDSDLKARRVLEIGCGRGGFARWLELQGAQLVAADFSEAALRMAQEHFSDSSIHWTQQDIQRLTFPDESFDTVISCETVEHVPRPRQALGELTRVLRSGGTLILTCPNYLGSMGLYRLYLRLTGRRFTEEGQPINQFVTAPVILYWLRSAGLAVEDFRGHGHYLPVPGRPPLRAEILDRFGILRLFALHTAFRARKGTKR